MHMSFWWDYNIGDLFFNGATVQSIGKLVLVCGVFMIASIVYEGLKVLETKMRREKDLHLRRMSVGPCSDERNDLIRNNYISERRNRDQLPWRYFSFSNSCALKSQRVLTYTANSTINYFIMLAIMLYNGYIFLAIVIGITIGYFVFGYIGDYFNRKSIIERTKTRIVCEPECEDNANNENRSTPPYAQDRNSINNEFTCEVQINSPCRVSRSGSLEDLNVNLLHDDERQESCCSKNTSSARKTADVSKIKGRKSDCCKKSEISNDDSYNKLLKSDAEIIPNEEGAQEKSDEKEKSSNCCKSEKM